MTTIPLLPEAHGYPQSKMCLIKRPWWHFSTKGYLQIPILERIDNRFVTIHGEHFRNYIISPCAFWAGYIDNTITNNNLFACGWQQITNSNQHQLLTYTLVDSPNPKDYIKPIEDLVYDAADQFDTQTPMLTPPPLVGQVWRDDDGLFKMIHRVEPFLDNDGNTLDWDFSFTWDRWQSWNQWVNANHRLLVYGPRSPWGKMTKHLQ